MITAEKNKMLLEKIQALPEALQLEVEHYVEFLHEKYVNPSIPQKNPETKKKKRDGFGILKGKIWMSEDFDEPLEDMQEYM